MGSTALHFSHHAALKSTTTCAHASNQGAVAAGAISSAHRLCPSLHQRLAQLCVASHLTHVCSPAAARGRAFGLGRERRRRPHQAGRRAAWQRHACTRVADTGGPGLHSSGGAVEQLVWTRKRLQRVDKLVPARAARPPATPVTGVTKLGRRSPPCALPILCSHVRGV